MLQLICLLTEVCAKPSAVVVAGGQCVHEELTTPDLQNQLQLTIPCTMSKQKVRNELSLYLVADGGGVDLRDWGRTWYRTEGWDEEAPAATRHHFDLIG